MQKMQVNEWGLNGQLMATAAMRYCLGRRSYIVGACLEWVEANRHRMDRTTKRVAVRDICEALQDGSSGCDTIDAPGWRKLAELLFSEMPQEDKDWVKREVAYRGEWPLELHKKEQS